MTLEEFIQAVKEEHALDYDNDKVKQYVINAAEKMAEGKSSICLADDDVRKIILEYDPVKEEVEEELPKQVEIKAEPIEVKENGERYTVDSII